MDKLSEKPSAHEIAVCFAERFQANYPKEDIFKMIELNKIYNENCLETMKRMPDNFVDLVVTSPPYDGLRDYNGYSFPFEEIATELKRVLKVGGVIVWVVGDATINGSETLTSFKQALFFQSLGLNVHDTMIWNKMAFSAVGTLKTRYASVFEYMFVFSNGKPKTFNPIKDKVNVSYGRSLNGSTVRQKDGTSKPVSNPEWIIPAKGQRFNVWEMPAEMNRDIKHPAPFPEDLASDHIYSWSNEGDLIYDCFGGSGTTAKMAHQRRRKFILSEVSKEYCDMAESRIASTLSQTFLF